MTEDQIALGQRMLASGSTWKEVVRTTGCSIHHVKKALDPEYQERRREKDRRRYRQIHAQKTAEAGHRAATAIPPSEARRALASIPRDTRNLTARVLGDPLPGRSALEQGRTA